MIEIHSATPADIDRIAEVLTRAFQDDPGSLVYVPDPERRRATNPAFFRMFATAALADGADVVVPADDVTGVAIWNGPASFSPSESAMVTAGLEGVMELLGPRAAGRLAAMVGELEAQHDARMHGPHLRLEFFGVWTHTRRGAASGVRSSTTGTAGRTRWACRADRDVHGTQCRLLPAPRLPGHRDLPGR